MTVSRFRTGATLGAALTLMLLASCGDLGSLLAPSDAKLGRVNVVEPSKLTPGTDHAGGPALSLYNSTFRYTYPSGSYTTDPASWVVLEVTAGEPVTMNWFGRFRGGAHLRCYRWTLDIEDIFDETPRLDEATDLAHWSQRSTTTKSATVGPFAAGEQHLLYIEVEDTNGYRSLATIHIQVVAEPLAEEVRHR